MQQVRTNNEATSSSRTGTAAWSTIGPPSSCRRHKVHGCAGDLDAVLERLPLRVLFQGRRAAAERYMLGRSREDRWRRNRR